MWESIAQLFNFANMSVWEIVGQILGFIAMAAEFTIYQRDTKQKIILTKLVADLIWTTHFLLIGGITGAATTAACIFREIIFYCSITRKWAQSRFWVVLFCSIFIGCGIATWKGFPSVLPVTCSVISTIAFWVPSPKHTKILQTPSVIGMFIYNVIIHSFAGIVNGILNLSSLILYFVRLLLQNRKNPKETP